MVEILGAPLRVLGRLRTRASDALGAARNSLFWTLLVRQRTWFRWTLFLFFANFTLTLLITNLVADMVDQGIVAGAVPLRGYVTWIIGLAAIQFVVGFAMRQGLMRLTYQVEFDLRTWLYTRIQSAELQHLDSVSSGQLVSRALTDLNTMESLLRLIPIVGGIVPVILGLTLYVAVLNPLMAVVAFIPLPVNVWLLSKVRSRLWVLSFQELNERGELTSAIDEPVRGIRVVQAFGREDEARSRVARVALRVYRFAMTRVRILARADILLRFVPVAFQALALLIGARIVGQGFLTLGEFLIAFQLIAQVMGFAQMFADVASLWQYLRSAQSRIGEVLAMGRPPVSTGRTLPPPSTGLALRSVTVNLGGRAVLDDFDLAVRPGELVVLTGPPGSGKSTVAGTAAGMLGVDDGVVELDGVSLADLDPRELSTAVRVVSEHPFLFATTARENLELAVVGGSADDEALRRALWAARADDVVADLPNGLDSHIGDRGLTLSGGQRQRLALARALVAPPRVLVLDDALSAVNPSMEVEILRRIREHAPGTAVLCISRRSGPGAIADRVLSLPEPPDETADAVVAASARRDGLAEAMHARASSITIAEDTPRLSDARATDDAPPTLRAVLRPFAVFVVVAVVMLMAQTFLTRITPDLLFGNVADIIGNNDTAATDRRGLALLVIGFVGALSAYVFRLTSQRFVQGLLYLLRRRTFARLTRLGIDYYDRETPGQVAARMVNDLDVIHRFLEGQAFAFVVFATQMVMATIALFVLSPSVTVVVLFFAMVIAGMTAIQLPISMRAYDRARTELGRVTSMFEEDFTGRHEIRGFGASARQMRRFTRACWELRTARRWATGVANLYTELVNLIGQTMAVVVLFRSGNLVLAGSLSVGTALALQLMAKSATQPLPIMASSYAEALDARVSWRRLRQPFSEPILPDQRTAAVRCDELRGEIVFDKVAFAYPHTGRTVLHEVSFAVPAGAAAAVVGYTGAGKSSIAKLLSRVYDPDRGAVLVDGYDLRDLDLHTYRRRIGVVPQDSFVFRGTVASNIAYGVPDASREQIETAARAVGAHDTLVGLEGGYDHPVEEEGCNLTAAQRQLIALARAWLTAPDVLVLDEATSSLDAALERKVLDAMSRLDCTMVMITHRESVVAYADLVVVLDAGRVVEMGPRSELVGAGGVYDRLWTAEPGHDDVLVGAGATLNGSGRPRRRRAARREAQ
ncbi:MAG: ABC transporter ATP-binding protein/permease [Actinobacteria bacterium]|nr:ABC transporter ATP-binding protein/permease [Actinomycetota bacterium]